MRGNRKTRREAERLEQIPPPPPVIVSVTRQQAKTVEVSLLKVADECESCRAHRKAKGLVNDVVETKVADGVRFLFCHVCKSTFARPRRRYDSSMRQEMNVAGPCPKCSKESPDAPQDTRVYSKGGETRYCRCNRCLRMGRKTTWPWTPRA